MGHPLSQAKENLQALENQQHEVWSQFSKIEKEASQEAKNNLLAKWNTILAQVNQAEQNLLRALHSPNEELTRCPEDQKITILNQQEEMGKQKQDVDRHLAQNEKSDKKLTHEKCGETPLIRVGICKRYCTNVQQAREKDKEASAPKTVPLIA